MVAGDSNDRAIKLGIQMTEVYQQFVESPLGLSSSDSFHLLISSVIGAYASSVTLPDMILGLESQIAALELVSGGNR